MFVGCTNRVTAKRCTYRNVDIYNGRLLSTGRCSGPLKPTVAIMGTAIKHPMSDGVTGLSRRL